MGVAHSMDYQLPHPATESDMFLHAAVCELQRLNRNLESLIAAQAAPPQPSPEVGGSSEGVEGDGSVVVTLKEPKGKKLVKE